ncbi:ribosomal RNA small subunit methyltransferase A [candidate division WWE3 bacterium CG09_land_8_20_14_0_10_39_24]|uniref:Ribosomal RNA small subunit methyltransferase A n=1 Tax=candidate division WWE3 bacterium CG09_land_8_20_14_0_10_39_24 TaxID=1975088 RepID=A0A2H0WK37_UNCKA|nr:MAG: ribosomal RNA small subunit methyltransferase A [candidate division WWE3 bacterium CG09_land_8_20_14_0_10_39_24]PJE51799.1 MAG: ribosomal RNA small subunit methyltransferase A [candidate division WWE3 bacterium CG10_big_fil_rev_8_21_14_0_10_39_14]
MLKSNGMRAKKSFGQNFLIDKSVLAAFLEAVSVTAKDTILEAGAGTGIITAELVKLAKGVTAVELDKDLIPILKTNLKNFSNVQVIQANILNFLETYKTKIYKAVGAIPYNITSPLLHKLITLPNPPQSITLIIQQEVAEKICASPPKASYLSNFVSLYGTAKIIKKIKPSSFNPKPSVNSAVIHIEKNEAVFHNLTLKMWEKFLHKGFSQPRKMLVNIFKKEIFVKSDVSPFARAQELTLKDWEKIYNLIVGRTSQNG